MYVFNDDKSLWEPLSIPVPPNICSEPLTNPLGNCSDELIIPLPIVSYEPVLSDNWVIRVSNEEVVDSKLVNLKSFDDV